MVQPAEGLVVSPPVLERAQCSERRPKAVQTKLEDLCTDTRQASPRVRSLPALLDRLLGLSPDLFDEGLALPSSLSLYVPEGQQTLRATRALRHEGVRAAPANDASGDVDEAPPDSTPAGRAGARYAMLVWEVPAGLDLDVMETQTGPWAYPAQAKFDRLLRECRVPIGLLSNGSELRLVYAPLDAASGYIPFRVADMLQSDGRPILDAFLMLLESKRWFGVRAEDRLPAILVESRQRQAEVTNALSRQVFEALEILLAGFQAAAARDGGEKSALYRTLGGEEDRVYAGLLTLLLRLVFLLYCEDHRLLPSEHELFSRHYSLLGLFEQLQEDHDRTPDSMGQRFGAYPRLIALFRLVYLGGKHTGKGGDAPFDLPERRGELFDPNEYPFLEGWGPGGSAPVASVELRQAVRVPTVDDGTVYRVLERLIVLDGQRLSYRSLRVEQIGGVYEALMGFAVQRLQHDAVRLRLGGAGSVWLWLEAAPLLTKTGEGGRTRFLTDELGFDNAEAKKIVSAVGSCITAPQVLEKLERLGGRNPERAKQGTLVLQPSLERRRTSSHYTPPELAQQVVARALEPLLATMGPAPKSESLLNLVVCDPAMGSGAFLVAACEYIATQLVAAWSREGREQLIGNAAEDVTLYAKRLVAQRCLLGVDKNRHAVQLARISLWLTTLSRHEPFTFVDHALRYGDSLVGLSLEHIQAFHWKPPAQAEALTVDLGGMVDEALEKRRALLELARRSGVRTSEKQRLLFQARDALADLRLVGDVLLGAFFAGDKDREREEERKRRRDVVQRWLSTDGLEAKDAARSKLEQWQSELRQTQVPFHWMLEYPEVFCDTRLDPLDGDEPNGLAWVDSFIGNPPFMGGSGVSGSFGAAYRDWLPTIHAGAHGNADLSAHFYRRAHSLLGKHGTIGLVATNTIAQGDTRQTGLSHLIARGGSIYHAQNNLPWPGDAAVTVAICHLAFGRPALEAGRAVLDGRVTAAISSRLLAFPERPDPRPLQENQGQSFLGTKIYGQGFVLSPDQRDTWVGRSAANEQRIFPYLGGEEVNTSPTQSHDRYVINFGQMKLDEAARWPDLIRIVRESVKPERDTNNRKNYRELWWQFGETRPGLHAAIDPLQRCLVTARVTKHLCFSFQPTDRILNEKLYVFPFEAYTQFAILQSRAHEAWTWLLSSTLETRLNYAASDCFETFPFPDQNPRALLPQLETIGEALYTARASFMVDTDQGLTRTYNALKDPNDQSPRILMLRDLHEKLDRAVLDAYGWKDLEVPPYCPRSPAESIRLQAFKDDVIDRLFVLNAARATCVAPPSPRARPVAKTRPRTPSPSEPRSIPISAQRSDRWRRGARG